MIKSFTATTIEIDDPKAAAAEILAQLNLNELLKNSIGIVTCFSEFGETGVLEEIAKNLPFDCVGTTTCLCAANGKVDQLMLAVNVLTSDDCDFKAINIPLTANYDSEIDYALKSVLSQNSQKPALLLSYIPLINAISGDMIIESIDKATDGIPLFGTTAVDHTMDYGTAQTIYNDKMFRESLVLCAVYGNPKIEYEMAALDENKIRKQKAVITSSNGNILTGVNGKKALEYLEEIGLSKAELATGLGILPLIVDHKDGTKPVARAVFALTPDGEAVCGGKMPVNATLSIGQVDYRDVLNTTEKTLREFNDKNTDGVILSYSCMARYLALGASNTVEAEKVTEIIGDNQYMFACSGGEVCPLPDSEGRLKNFYHNYTIVFCRLS